MRTAGNYFADFRDPNYDQILEHPKAHIDLFNPKSMLKELSPQEVWEEAEAEYQQVLERFQSMLQEKGWTACKDMVEGKRNVCDAWRRECRVLLDQAQTCGSKIYRYSEGKNGSTGYVIFQDGKPKYWLHVQFNGERDQY